MNIIPSAAAIILIAAVLVSGCAELSWVLGTGEEMACSGTAVKLAQVDPDHCYQDAAIRKSDTELCEKIESPPPRTKCYMLIAEKDGDKDVCEKMQNYPGSGEYSRLECLQRVAVKTGDSSICDEIGTASVSYMFTGVISKETCYEKTGGRTGVNLAQMYMQKPENFEFCEDLAYAQIYGQPPPATQGSHKNEVGAKLTDKNAYSIVSEGYVMPGTSPNVNLKDGDILVLGFDATPNPSNANHYAVVQGSKVSQILSWKDPSTNKQVGSLDSQDLSWYFTTRTVTNPYTKEEKTSPQVYKHYIVYRKK